MFETTEYVQRLTDDLDGLDFIKRAKIQQENWTGRSTDVKATFQTAAGDAIVVYTTRPDTLSDATCMVLFPEYKLVCKWLESGALKNAAAITDYQKAATSESDLRYTELNKGRTGVHLDGVRGVSPVDGREIPVFISDYVSSTCGTGAVVAVPTHDDRSWEFTKKFGYEIIKAVPSGKDVQQAVFTTRGNTSILVNSNFLNDKTVKDAIPAMTRWLEEKDIGAVKVNYKLRDWIFFRQRYWGGPVPMVYYGKCGRQPLLEGQLPLLLPEVDSHKPTDGGESPLGKATGWVSVIRPCCGGPVEQEIDATP